MGYNKIIYGGNTLIDLTADTVAPENLLSGQTAHDKSGELIEGTCPFDVDSTDATAAAAEILSGKTAYGRGSKITGTMKNNGAITKKITSKNESYVVPVGYHDGSGTVAIDANEKEKIIPTNIRVGIEILGVTGTMTGVESITSQSKMVTPSTAQQVIIPDEEYDYLSQVTVKPIPYTEVANSAGGTTVTIAG